jgi:hypothetical protein
MVGCGLPQSTDGLEEPLQQDLAAGVVTNTLNFNEQLNPGQQLTSTDGRYKLVLQPDSNLVLYVVATNQALWASNTWNKASARAIFQGDGNFVIYNTSGAPTWASGTNGRDARFVRLENTGNLAIYNSANAVIWQTNTAQVVVRNALTAEQRLNPGEQLTSTSGKYKLVFQTDGNLRLLIAATNVQLWQSNTAGQGANRAILQTDGNFVIYSPTRADWATGTNGRGTNLARLNDDGSFTLYAGTATIWTTGPAPGEVPDDRLTVNEQLDAGKFIVSPNGRFKVVFQADSNLVLYDGSNGSAPWASNTVGKLGTRVLFQTDGNLVMYPAGRGPENFGAVWSTGTNGKGATMARINDNGSFGIYTAAGVSVWNTPVIVINPTPVDSTLDLNEVLPRGGARLQSPNRRFELAFRTDGNLVLTDTANANRVEWQSNTANLNATQCIFQGDGNLVIYPATGPAIWASGTYGRAPPWRG